MYPMAYPTTILKNGLIKFWLRNSWGDHFETCSDSNFYADEFRNSSGSIWKMCFSSWKLCRSTIPEQQHQSERHKHMLVLEEKYLDILFWRSFIDTAPLHGLWHHELSMFDIIVRDAIPTVSTLSSEHPSSGWFSADHGAFWELCERSGVAPQGSWSTQGAFDLCHMFVCIYVNSKCTRAV